MTIRNNTPIVESPRLSGLLNPLVVPVSKTLTTAGGVITLTVAELLGGLLRINCDDAQSLTFPTSALIMAALNGPQIGTAFDVDVINYGDTTLTMVLGTGQTKFGIGSIVPVLTLATLTSKRFRFVVTGIQTVLTAGSTDTFDVYTVAASAAVVA